MPRKIALVLGIRPDLVRAAKLINLLKSHKDLETLFIWSGQHYSSNLKDDFLAELQIPTPDYELEVSIGSDSEIISSGISSLSNLLDSIQPELVLFLGDTNTVVLSVAAHIKGIPVFHIEGCMRSFDLEMPEERNRKLIDHISTRIFAYLPRYKRLGIEEGIPEESIIVTGNLAVDAIEYFTSLPTWENFLANSMKWRKELGLPPKYAIMTCHRRENINSKKALQNILILASKSNYKTLFPASYATQRRIEEYGLEIPKNIVLTDPLEYGKFLPSLMDANLVLTDSGTVVEEAAILNIPSIQMRRSTERPEVYYSGASTKFNPFNPDFGLNIPTLGWKHGLGDGRASEKIVEDIINWLEADVKPNALIGQPHSIKEAWGVPNSHAELIQKL